MKILVLSDSHCAMDFMRECVEKWKPDCVIHLGDHYADGQLLHKENPDIAFYQVPGNCDRHRLDPFIAQTLCCRIGGVKMLMTHGHLHNVKLGIGKLLADARRHGVQIVLYGHTHRAECFQSTDGLWVMNPGSCGFGGSVGLITVEAGKISACAIRTHAEISRLPD